MVFNLINLNKDTRQKMLTEVESDIAESRLYKSKYFTPKGDTDYPSLLKAAIENGNEQSLTQSLDNQSYFKEMSTRNTEKGAIPVKVPKTAAVTFAEGEFNRFYMRGLCLLAIEQAEDVEVYRAKDVQNPREESERLIGKKLNSRSLLEDLRKDVEVDKVLGLPTGPNSGLSIKLSS